MAKNTPFSINTAIKTKKKYKSDLEQKTGMTSTPVKMKETPRPSYTVTDTSIATTAKKIGRAIKAAATSKVKNPKNVKKKKK